MSETQYAEWQEERDEWIAAGRPSDSVYASKCAESFASASAPAIGFRSGDTYTEVEVR